MLTTYAAVVASDVDVVLLHHRKRIYDFSCSLHRTGKSHQHSSKVGRDSSASSRVIEIAGGE